MTASSEGQLRPGLWQTINERYPGSMIRKADRVMLSPLLVPLPRARLSFVSSAGVQLAGSLPFDVAHPIGDFSFRRVPTDSRSAELEIQQSVINPWRWSSVHSNGVGSQRFPFRSRATSPPPASRRVPSSCPS